MKLKEAGLEAKLTKGEFLKYRIQYLDCTIQDDGIHTLDDKILTIKNFPPPRSVHNDRSFSIFSEYYKSFINQAV